jgi:hypothetical protein
MRAWINGKVIVGAILVGTVMFAALFLLLWSVKPEIYTRAASTPILSVIQAPTETPILRITASPTAEPTTVPGVPTPSGDIAIGDYVQVTGTGGDGLRVHSSPGVSTEVRYVAIDAEVFVVKDGPVEADGYTWWQLQDPYNLTMVGWGATNYLSVVKNPN